MGLRGFRDNRADSCRIISATSCAHGVRRKFLRTRPISDFLSPPPLPSPLCTSSVCHCGPSFPEILILFPLNPQLSTQHRKPEPRNPKASALPLNHSVPRFLFFPSLPACLHSLLPCLPSCALYAHLDIFCEVLDLVLCLLQSDLQLLADLILPSFRVQGEGLSLGFRGFEA